MPSEIQKQSKTGAEEDNLMQGIFDDYDARTNFVGFFDLLYKIDRRLEPERYEEGADLP